MRWCAVNNFFPDRMHYLKLFDTASRACGLRQEWHPVVKTLFQYSSLTLMKKEIYEEEVQPYRKTDSIYFLLIFVDVDIWNHLIITHFLLTCVVIEVMNHLIITYFLLSYFVYLF